MKQKSIATKEREKTFMFMKEIINPELSEDLIWNKVKDTVTSLKPINGGYPEIVVKGLCAMCFGWGQKDALDAILKALKRSRRNF